MKKIKILAIAVLVALAGTFLFTNEKVFKADISQETVIEDGVFIGGIDVSGMNAQEATDAVNKYVDTLKPTLITLVGPKGNVKLTLEDMGISANTDVAVQEAVAVGHSGNLIKRFQALQDLKGTDLVIDMGLTIDKQIVAQTLYNKSERTNIKAIDNGLKRENDSFVYVPGQEGNEVDIVASVNALEELIGSQWELEASDNTEFTLTSVVSSPRGTQEELSVVKDLMGSFTTNYKTSSSGRAKNVETGASKINGTVLYPGDELSVYAIVNPFTKENGYELAGAYSNGETIESFGGGICQVSTTLYNAALNAELEITKRYNHSMVVTYVDPAADAAIAGTYKDLRFKNSYDFPIYIEGVCKNRNITFNIYGVETRPENRKVTYVSEIISTNDPETEYTLSSSHPVGSYIQTRSKHVGYVAKYWKIVTIDGVEQEKKQMNKSTYQASCKKVTIGTAGATEAQLAAIKEALATKNDDHIKAVVKGLSVAAQAAPAPVPEAGNTGNGGSTGGDAGTGEGSDTGNGDTGTSEGNNAGEDTGSQVGTGNNE